MGISDRRPKPSVQEVLATDTNPAPPLMRTESPADGWPTDDVSAERYFSKEWHDREVETVWRKCWQLACREEEIPNVGDHIVYEIVHDSLIVVRTSPTEIRAEDGSVTGTFTIPKDVPKGSHRIALVTKTNDGKPTTLTVGVRVGEWEKGANVAIWLIVLPIVLSIAGALILPATRRRRRTA